MSSPIDTAFVAIEPDASGFARDAERDVDRVIGAIEREFKDLTSTLERTFAEMGDQLAGAFDGVAASANRHFDAISREAEGAGHSIANDIERGAESAERSLDELGRHAKTEFAKVEREADKTKSGLVSKLGGIGGLLAIGVGGAATAVTAGLGAIATFGLQSAAAMEQSKIQFASLTGSVEKGNAVFAELQKFAATTPFEFPDVAHAAARFLAFDDAVGISDKQLDNFLTTVGNVVSVTGGGAEALNSVTLAMGQIASSGKLTLDNLNQISEAMPGFSAVAAIASAQGKTTAQVMDEISKGTINAKDGVAALLKGMDKFPGAAGAMAAQGQTLEGVFSTFKDTIGQSLANAFAPAIPGIKDALAKITPLLGDSLGKFAPVLGEAITSLLPVVSALITGLTPILSLAAGILKSLGGLGPALAAVGKIIEVLLTPLSPLLDVIVQVANVLAQALVPVAEALAPIIGALAKPIADLVLALLPVIPPLGQIIGLLITIAAPLLKFTSFLISLLASKAIAPLIQLLADGLTQLLKPLGAVSEWINNLDWGKIWKSIVNALSVAWDAVSNFFVGLGHWFADLPGNIGSWLASLPGLLVGLINSAFDALLHAIGVGIGLIIYEFIHLPEQIIAGISALGGMLGDFFTGLWNDIVNLAVTGATNLVNFFIALPGRIWAALKALPGVVGNIFISLFNGVKSLVVNGFMWVVNQITSIPGKIAGLAGKFVSAGKGLITGFINGFKNVGHFIGDVAGSITGAVKGFLNNVIGKINGGIADIDKYLPGTLPRIPYLASGGIAYGPALIGEKMGGKGEAAIPLDDPRALSALKNALGGVDGGGGVVFQEGAITVVFSGVVPSDADARRVGQLVAANIGETMAANRTRNAVRSI